MLVLYYHVNHCASHTGTLNMIQFSGVIFQKLQVSVFNCVLTERVERVLVLKKKTDFEWVFDWCTGTENDKKLRKIDWCISQKQAKKLGND